MPQRDFLDVVTDLDDGKVHQKLTDELAKMIAAVQETSLSGAITLTLKAKPKGREVYVVAEIKAKVPKEGNMATLFFVDKGGSLTREDPAQLSLRTVPAKPEKLHQLSKDKE